MTRYGYVGIGSMGAAMAKHLLSTGHPLTVYDVNEAAVARLVELGATRAASSAEVAEASDVVSVCVPAAHHVEAVISGADSLSMGAHDNLTVLIHSTVHPDTMIGAAVTMAEHNVAVHDACVAGGMNNAEIGKLVVFAGALAAMPPEAVELLEIYGEKIIDAGPIGTGAAIKIAVNVMTYAQFTAAAVSNDLVKSAGGDTKSLFEAWRFMGMLGSLTEQFSAMLDLPPEFMTGDTAAHIEGLAGIGQKDLELAKQLDREPSKWTAVLDGLITTLPRTYGVEATYIPEDHK